MNTTFIITTETKAHLEPETSLNRQLSEVGLSGVSSTDEDSNDWDFAVKKSATTSANIKAQEKSTPSLLTNINLKEDANPSPKNVQRKTILIQDHPASSKYVIYFVFLIKHAIVIKL